MELPGWLGGSDGTVGQPHVIFYFFFSFPNFCGLDCAIFILVFFKEGVMGRRRLVLCRLKHKLFVLGTRLCYMISAMGAPRHHFPVQTTNIYNSC